MTKRKSKTEVFPPLDTGWARYDDPLYQGLDWSPFQRRGDVAVLYHTYSGVVVYGQQVTHRVFLPLNDARTLLRRLLRHNLTWGWGFPGAAFVPFFALLNYRAQVKSVIRQDAEGYVPRWLQIERGADDVLPFLHKFFVVLSLVLCWAPIIGLVLSGMACLGARKGTRGWRVAAGIALLLAISITVLLVIKEASKDRP